MTLLPNYENSWIYFCVLWTIPFGPISHRISTRMFSYITLCKYTYHSSICLLAIILSIQSFQSSYNHTGHEPLSPVRIVYYVSNYLFFLYGKFAYLTNESWEICYCPASRTTLVATRFRVAVICPIIQVPHCIRLFFYFVWFVFINHIFQFYYESCTYCNILDIYLS